jgi:hypothetical protein
MIKEGDTANALEWGMPDIGGKRGRPFMIRYCRRSRRGTQQDRSKGTDHASTPLVRLALAAGGDEGTQCPNPPRRMIRGCASRTGVLMPDRLPGSSSYKAPSCSQPGPPPHGKAGSAADLQPA